jgi:ABC-2 type transport system permease protein
MQRSLSLILTLAAKDWRLFFADKRAAVLCFAVPIILASAFGLIFAKPENRSDSMRLPLLLVVESEGPFTNEIVRDFLASERMEVEIATQHEALKRIADKRPSIAVVLPANLETLAAWVPGTPAERPAIRILHNPMCQSEGQWAEGLVSEVLMNKLAKAAMSQFGEVPTIPFTVHNGESQGTRAGFNAYSHSFSGMTLQYLLFWGMESGLLLLRDRQRSLWLRMRAAPVPLSTILLGKALSTAAIAFLQILATFGFGYLAFGVTIGGSMAGFLLIAMAVSVLAAATGLLVAAMGGTEARARSICILAILGVSMLGGLWLPSFVLPAWARDLALSLPTTWAMRGFDSVTWQGGRFVSVLPNIGVLFGFTAAFVALALARFITTEARRRRGFA